MNQTAPLSNRFRPTAGLVLLSLVTGLAGAALADDAPPAMSIIADQVRSQGFACDTPQSAKHDAQASKPGEDVWTLACDNGSYRVTLIPDEAAKIEKLN